jgi:hypothetical protein
LRLSFDFFAFNFFAFNVFAFGSRFDPAASRRKRPGAWHILGYLCRAKRLR